MEPAVACVEADSGNRAASRSGAAREPGSVLLRDQRDQAVGQEPVEARPEDGLEGHQRLELKGQWSPETAALPAGALFVPIAQPKARLVAQLLEPQAPDSLAAWGLFNTAFEQKEYMEDYVAEAVAREMLAADPALRRRFEEKLRSDPEFAGSPAARLDFFYRLHPAWDRDLNRYPVLRLDTPP